MPRPPRIQFENALYHVMNRGRGRQVIYPGEHYYQAFLKTLEESHNRFDAIIHAYCLMGNHYHLMIETPRANLDRIMRHINGVYTQRYNRLKNTDGTLFRGRYKAILVDKDAYLLQLSRYIHRNPATIKGTASDALSTYPWSSYPAYINQVKAEPWLARNQVYQMLGKRQKYVGYRAFVEAEVNDEIEQFYSKGNIAAILGNRGFREAIVEKKQQIKISGQLAQALSNRPSAKAIVSAVAEVFATPEATILRRKSGRQTANLPRKFAMYCCQQQGDMSLKSIANLFGLKHEGSVSPAVHDIRQCLAKGKLIQQLDLVEKFLDIIK